MAWDIDGFSVAHGISRATTYKEIRGGRLRVMKVRKLTRISMEAAADWRRLCEADATIDSDRGRRLRQAALTGTEAGAGGPK